MILGEDCVEVTCDDSTPASGLEVLRTLTALSTSYTALKTLTPSASYIEVTLRRHGRTKGHVAYLKPHSGLIDAQKYPRFDFAHLHGLGIS